MKKVFLFVAVAGVFTLASCKKDRTCTCTYADGTKDVTVYKKATKSGTHCYDRTSTYTSSSGTSGTASTVTCSLD